MQYPQVSHELPILQGFFPNIFLTSEDIYIFYCDPREFVHHQRSLLSDFYTLWMTNITLITDLIKHCRIHVTQGRIGLITQILSCYA